MGLLDGIMGNASEIDVAAVAEEFKQILGPDERTEKAYQLIRDTIVFTDKRLIYVDRQGITGKKVEYQSIRTGTSPGSASRPRARSISTRS
jgi:hypothetical protein